MGRGYDTDWFDRRREGARRSAEAVLPHLVDWIEPRGMLDLGCGTGSWLAVARQLGIEDILGIDGDYVDRMRLEIPPDRFVSHDLTQPLRLDRAFDVALCLEVGEHLPSSAAGTLVDSLVRHAPVVVFSAAIPEQGGNEHINEQWQDWWADLFAQRGYVPVDCLRRAVWEDERVSYFYAQNSLLYVHEDALGRYPKLKGRHEGGAASLRVVHPRLYIRASNRFPRPEVTSFANAARFGARLIASAVRSIVPRRPH